MTRVAAIVLAAGRSRRFGALNPTNPTKAVAQIRGVPLVRAVATVALCSRAVSVTVVCGHAHAEVEAALSGLEVAIVHNTDFATGMASSLKAGVAAVAAQADGVLVMLADMPCVRADTLDGLIGRFDGRQAVIDAVVPVSEGRRGNPVLIGRRLFARIQDLSGDEGARALLLQPDLAIDLLDVSDPGVAIDIDTPVDLAALKHGTGATDG